MEKSEFSSTYSKHITKNNVLKFIQKIGNMCLSPYFLIVYLNPQHVCAFLLFLLLLLLSFLWSCQRETSKSMKAANLELSKSIKNELSNQ